MSLETEHGSPRGAIQRLEAPQYFFFFDVSELTLSKCHLANYRQGFRLEWNARTETDINDHLYTESRKTVLSYLFAGQE